MFGHIQVNPAKLSEQDKSVYRRAYCGLCHTLGKEHGMSARLALSYDFTFLILLLSSLYEPENMQGTGRCIVHPAKKHEYLINNFTRYAADMTVALTYFKCMDDWADDKNAVKWTYASVLRPQYIKVKGNWPLQCSSLERELRLLSRLEADREPGPDAAANCCGRFMAEIFSPFEDNWTPHLKKIGFGIGKFIYLADAACDYSKDEKKGGYNPLILMTRLPGDIRPHLMGLLGDVSEAFEFLPLVEYTDILKNILYSGIWQQYNLHIGGEQQDD